MTRKEFLLALLVAPFAAKRVAARVAKPAPVSGIAGWGHRSEWSEPVSVRMVRFYHPAQDRFVTRFDVLYGHPSLEEEVGSYLQTSAEILASGSARINREYAPFFLA